jgi:hypothetical protein
VGESKTLGRPTLFREEYCDRLIEWMRTGMSFESFAGEIEVDRDTIYHWTKIHPIFSDAKKKACALRDKFVEQRFMASTLNPAKYPTRDALMIFLMKNACGWKDKQDISVSELPPIELKYPKPEW